MHAVWASEAGTPEVPNEDFLIASSDGFVLLDGGTTAGLDSGCRHGVMWYVRALGTALAPTLGSHHPLSECLAAGIKATCAEHEQTCDLTHPGTPASTVVIVRVRRTSIEYLVLADSTIVIEYQDEPTQDSLQIITDDREAAVARRIRAQHDQLNEEDPALQRRALGAYITQLQPYRNREGGFWVASTSPEAADHAIAGTVPRDRVRQLTALTDGATRLIDRFDMLGWPQAIDGITREGPLGLIARTREAERKDPHGTRWPRGKLHDDATIIRVDRLG